MFASMTTRVAKLGLVLRVDERQAVVMKARRALFEFGLRHLVVIKRIQSSGAQIAKDATHLGHNRTNEFGVH